MLVTTRAWDAAIRKQPTDRWADLVLVARRQVEVERLRAGDFPKHARGFAELVEFALRERLWPPSGVHQLGGRKGGRPSHRSRRS